MQFYLVMFAHWMGDFVLQTEWMAINKSKLWRALTAHVAMYSAVLAVLAFALAPSWQVALQFIGVNAALHFVTDAVTSRVSSYFWDKNDLRFFFVTLGLDQFLHFVALYATWRHFLLTGS